MKLSHKQFIMIVILIAGTFIGVLNQTVITPALPSIMGEMAIDASTAQWLTTGFTLVNAIMIPITAFLTDRFSVRNLFCVSMGVFSLGSVLCGIGPNFIILLIGRLLQAAGAGILMPLVMTVFMLTFPPERRGSAMGLFGIVVAFAPAIGPSVAGLVVDSFSWHYLFYAIAILGAIVFVLGIFLIQNDNPESAANAKLDILSVILSSAGFGLLLYGFSDIGSNGIGALNIILTLAGAAVVIVFFIRQLRLETPMLNVRVLKHRNFLIGTIIGMLVQMALLAAEILMPIYLQTYMGYSATVSGLVVLPGAILLGVLGLFVGRIFDKHGPRLLSLIGLGTLIVCTFGFTQLSLSTSLVLIIVLYTLRMAGVALVNTPMMTWAMNSLDNSVMNHGTSVNNTLRQVAGSLGTAILISISTAVTNGAYNMTEAEAGVYGTNMAFLAGMILCIIGFIVAVIFVRNKPMDAKTTDPDDVRRNTLEQIMKRDVYVLHDTDSVYDAAQLFIDKGVNAVPIVDKDDKPVGFISDGDLTRYMARRDQNIVEPVIYITLSASQAEDLPSRIKTLMNLNVMDIATNHVTSADIHSNLDDIYRIMGDNHLKKMPITEDGQIVGVINRSDIIRYTMGQYLDMMNEAPDEDSDNNEKFPGEYETMNALEEIEEEAEDIP